MITQQIDSNSYEVFIYDWVEDHEDYLCGHIKRNPNADEESDLIYWMFYPVGVEKPMNAGDMRRIFEFITDLNRSI